MKTNFLTNKEKENQMKLILSKIVLVAVSVMYVGCCAVAGPIAGGAAPSAVDGDAALSGISKLILLDESDAKAYASNLQNLVGQYYQIVPIPNGGHALQLLGRASEDMKVDKIELKDNKILFKKVTDSTYSAGITIPWLNLQAKSGERLDTLIQDIATVSAPSSANFISKNLPDSGAIDPSLSIYYVSGATVTLVSQKMYTTKNVEGAIAIFGGKDAYVKDIISNGWLVSVTKILAKRPTTINKGISDKGISKMLSEQLYKDDMSVEGMIVSVRPPKKK